METVSDFPKRRGRERKKPERFLLEQFPDILRLVCIQKVILYQIFKTENIACQFFHRPAACFIETIQRIFRLSSFCGEKALPGGRASD